jgi:hypothetical protein
MSSEPSTSGRKSEHEEVDLLLMNARKLTFDCNRRYITEMAKAYSLDGVDVRGYMAWSLME